MFAILLEVHRVFKNTFSCTGTIGVVRQLQDCSEPQRCVHSYQRGDIADWWKIISKEEMELKHRRKNCIDNQVESRDKPGGWGIGTGSAQQKKN